MLTEKKLRFYILSTNHHFRVALLLFVLDVPISNGAE